jgi:predicted enzyme related to lactoylglutathione lyase
MNPFMRVEIYVDDLDRAKTFYERVFKLELSPLSAPEALSADMQMLTFPRNDKLP